MIPRKYIKTKNADEEIKTVKLPASPKNMNYRRMKTVLYISHQDSVLKGSCKEIFSGAVSTECRQKFIRDPNGSISEKIKLLKNSKSNNNLVLDSLVIDKQHSYPYNFNLNYKCALANSVTWPEKDLYSLALTGWLDHFQEEASKKRRFLGYYTKYQYTVDIKYYLVFDTPVEVVNSNQTEIKLKNNFGSYTFSLKQINDNTVLINSNYDIDNLYLPEKDYDQFRELSLASLKAEATQLFIKIKK